VIAPVKLIPPVAALPSPLVVMVSGAEDDVKLESLLNPSPEFELALMVIAPPATVFE